ncbi:MAG: RNA polymerase sigma factor [Myxococcota bacterium]
MSSEHATRLRDALVAGDVTTAFACLWRLYHRRVCAALWSHGVHGPAVEDVAQDVFARLYVGLDASRVAGLDAWVFAVAYYEALTWRKARRRGRTDWLELGERLHPPRGLDDPQARDELVTLLLEVRARLDGPANQCIFDCLDAGMTDREILAHVEATTDVRLTGSALRKRRARIRDVAEAHLRSAGWLK